MDLFILSGLIMVLLFCVIGLITKRFDNLENNLMVDFERILQNTCSHDKTEIICDFYYDYEKVCKICNKKLSDATAKEYQLERVERSLEGTGYKPVKIKKEVK